MSDIATVGGRLPVAVEAPVRALSDEDLAALRNAVRALEQPGLAARLSAAAGAPLELLGRSLPAPVTTAVARSTETAMRAAMRVALATLPRTAAVEGGTAVVPAEPVTRGRLGRLLGSGEIGHKAMAAASGAIGGAFGIATLAVELPVSTTLMLRAIAEIAREHKLGILYGYPERDANGAIFNSVQLIDRQGERRANYRKTHLYGDLDRSQFSASDEPPAIFELDGWKIGLLICFDVEFPEAVRTLALAGADLVLVPTANMRPYEFVAQVLVPTRAYENQVFLAYANYVGNEEEIEYCGLSSIVAPDGQVLTKAKHSEELLVAELDPQRIALAREGYSYVHLRRPVLYRS